MEVHCRMTTLSVMLVTLSTILLTQFMSHIPVLITTGLPIVATLASIGRLLLSPDPILMKGTLIELRNSAETGSMALAVKNTPFSVA